MDTVETLEEAQDLSRWVRQHRVEMYETYAEEYGRLRDMVTERLEGMFGDAYVTGKEPFALYQKGIAERLFPDMFDDRDQDANLVELHRLTQLDPGVYERDGFLLFAHSHLRRHYGNMNALNYELLRALSEAESLGPKARVALDPELVGLAPSFKPSRDVQDPAQLTIRG